MFPVVYATGWSRRCLYRTGNPVIHPGTARSHPTLVLCEISDQTVAASTSRRVTRVRKGEETRQEIIRKAAPIFNRKGYSGAALSDLMRATGLEKGGIYRHF